MFIIFIFLKMHDLHEANKIAKLIHEHADKNDIKKVSKVLIELGKVIEHGEEINPDNLKFNVKMLCRDILSDDSQVTVKIVDSDSWNLKEIEGE